MKIAVILPGVGYHKDKPLLYYASKLVRGMGYEVIDIEYHDMPQKIRGNAEMMKKAAELAFAQTSEQLAGIDLSSCEELLFIGKSIGTYVLAKYINDHELNAKQIWYTPVEATFMFGSGNVIAFIGDDDPWSDVGNVKKMAKDQKIELYSYPGCNHSLETDDVDINLKNLSDVMRKTRDFLAMDMC